MEESTVSIIIPTLNREKLIGFTIDSIFNQTYQNWECIVVDDGSTDNTEDLIKSYQKKDKRIKYFKRPTNYKSGGNGARNYGFEISTGKYINWFDSDDIMYPDFISQKVAKFKENQEINIVSSGFVKINKETNHESSFYNIDLKDIPIEEYLLKKLKLNTPTFMFERSFISKIKFDENLTRAQDLDFTFKAISDPDAKVSYQNVTLFQILIHNNSITGNFYSKKIVKNLSSELKVRKEIMMYYEKLKKRNDYVRTNYARVLKKTLENNEYRLYFKEIIRLDKIYKLKKSKLIILGLMYFFSKRGTNLLIKEFKV